MAVRINPTRRVARRVPVSGHAACAVVGPAALNIEAFRLTIRDMWKPSRRRVLAALAVFAVASYLIVAHRHRVTSEALSREFDLAVQKREAINAANMRRPVLRGEPTPGGGGHLLEKALRDVERQAEQYDPYGERLVHWLPRLIQDGGDPEEVDAAKRAFDELRVCLFDVRDALQHESCRLPQDADQTYWDQIGWQRREGFLLVGTLLLLEADLQAGQGDLRGALATISDTIRHGHDLRRGAPYMILSLTGISIEARAIRQAQTLLSSTSPAQEDLAPFLAELSILDRSRPSFPDCLEGVECEGVIKFVLQVRGQYPDIVPPRSSSAPFWQRVTSSFRGQPQDLGLMPRWRREYIKLAGFDFEEYHRLWRGFRKASALPVPEMRKMSDGLEMSPQGPRKLLEMDLKMQTMLACLRAAAMVHLYRAEHEGAWPEDLASVGQIPLDPYDGQPLRYKPPEEDRPPFVYSVGANLLDDGGRAERPMGFQADRGSHDFVFPLGPWPETQDGDAK